MIWGAATAFLVALLITAASLVHTGERDALARASDRVTKQADGAEAGLNRALRSLDLNLAALLEVTQPALGANERLDPSRAHRALATLKSSQLVFHDAALLDEAGRTLAAATPFSAQNGLQLPEGFAAQAWAQPAGRLHISQPARSGSSRAASMFLARTLAWPGGQRVLAVLEVPIALLGEIVSQAMDVTELVITLERQDGLLMLSLPADLAQAGHVLSAPAPALEHDAQRAAVQAPGRLDGAPALVAMRPLVVPALRVAVSLPLSQALAAWQRERMNMALVTLAFVVMTAAAAAIASAQFMRLWRARQALAQSSATLDQAPSAMADGFLLCDAQDRVLRWNEQYLVLFPWQRPVLRVGVPFRAVAEAGASVVVEGADPIDRVAWIEGRVNRHLKADQEWEQHLGRGMTVNAKERRTPEGGVWSACTAMCLPPSACWPRRATPPRPPTRPSRSSWPP